MVYWDFKKVDIRLFYALVLGLLLTAILPMAGFTAPIDLPRDSDGWTVFAPSADARIAYVSVDGNDDVGDVYSPQDAAIGSDPFNPAGPVHAFATYAEAFSRMRGGYPDWILLKRGDEFTFTIGAQVCSGRAADEPFLIGAYGPSGDSPLLKNESGSALRVDDAAYLAVSGIDFFANTRDPDSPDYVDGSTGYGINFLTDTGDNISGVLLEGCRFRFFQNNTIVSTISRLRTMSWPTSACPGPPTAP